MEVLPFVSGLDVNGRTSKILIDRSRQCTDCFESSQVNLSGTKVLRSLRNEFKLSY